MEDDDARHRREEAERRARRKVSIAISHVHMGITGSNMLF